MDSFLVPKSKPAKKDGDEGSDKLEYMIFVWNGKQTSSLLQSYTMSNAFELEDFVQRSEGPFLEVISFLVKGSTGAIQRRRVQK
jgi:hypothetical protein